MAMIMSFVAMIMSAEAMIMSFLAMIMFRTGHDYVRLTHRLIHRHGRLAMIMSTS